MVYKFAFLIICCLIVCQAVAFSSSRKARDTQDAANTIDGFIDDIKTGFQDLVTKVQSSDVLKDVSSKMQQFGQEVSAGATKLAEDTRRVFTDK